MRFLAGLRFTLVSAGQNFWRNLAVSLAAVFTMGLILLMVGGTLLGTHMLNQVLTDEQTKASTMKVYLEDGSSLASIVNYREELAQDPRVTDVAFENKDGAAKEARDKKALGPSLNVLGTNPLPASLNLDVKRLADLPALNSAVRQNPLVEQGDNSTDYNPDVINRLRDLIFWLQVIALVFVLVLGAISLVIIMNTIRTAVYVRRREIEIMKLVGATDWFVRGPFLIEGMLGGILAAGTAATLIAVAYKPAVDYLKSRLLIFPLIYDGSFLGVLVAALIVAGLGLGAFGSWLGVRRHLAV